MKYAVVQAANADTLAMYVEDMLSDGWACQGGVSIFWNAGGWKYAQAMIKEAPCPK